MLEIQHGFDANPDLVCECGSEKFHRLISGGLGFISKDSAAIQQRQETAKRHTDIRADLRDNYGVATIRPVLGKSLDNVYQDVKEQGTLIKDNLQATTEINAKRTKAKSKKWMKDALPRTEKRYKEKIERKRKGDAESKR